MSNLRQAKTSLKHFFGKKELIDMDTSSLTIAGLEKVTKTDETSQVKKRKLSGKPRGHDMTLEDPPLNLISDRFVSLVELAKKSRKFVGAHVSMAGGLEHALYNSLKIGGQAFALFLKSQRRWENPPLEDLQIKVFRNAMSHYKYDTTKILPHGSYLMNLGSPEKEMLEKGRKSFFDDMERCEKLGIVLYNFHPGSATGNDVRENCIGRIANSINLAHERSKGVICVIENMSGQGCTIGGDFHELASIIQLVDDKDRVGVCLDTCHLFAYGYDIRTAVKFDKVMRDFDSIVGLKYLRAIHLNDSKSELGSKKDRHANIGKGHLGMEAFKFIMNDSRFNDIPIILETPAEDGEESSVYQKEIDLLYSLVDIKTDS